MSKPRKPEQSTHPILRHWRQVILSPLELAVVVLAWIYGLARYRSYLATSQHLAGRDLHIAYLIGMAVLVVAGLVALSGIRRALALRPKPAWTESNCPNGYVLYDIEEDDESFWRITQNWGLSGRLAPGFGPLDLAKPNLDHKMRKAVFAPVLRQVNTKLEPGWTIIIAQEVFTAAAEFRDKVLREVAGQVLEVVSSHFGSQPPPDQGQQESDLAEQHNAASAAPAPLALEQGKDGVISVLYRHASEDPDSPLKQAMSAAAIESAHNLDTARNSEAIAATVMQQLGARSQLALPASTDSPRKNQLALARLSATYLGASQAVLTRTLRSPMARSLTVAILSRRNLAPGDLVMTWLTPAFAILVVQTKATTVPADFELLWRAGSRSEAKVTDGSLTKDVIAAVETLQKSFPCDPHDPRVFEAWLLAYKQTSPAALRQSVHRHADGLPLLLPVGLHHGAVFCLNLIHTQETNVHAQVLDTTLASFQAMLADPSQMLVKADQIQDSQSEIVLYRASDAVARLTLGSPRQHAWEITPGRASNEVVVKPFGFPCKVEPPPLYVLGLGQTILSTTSRTKSSAALPKILPYLAFSDATSMGGPSRVSMAQFCRDFHVPTTPGHQGKHNPRRLLKALARVGVSIETDGQSEYVTAPPTLTDLDLFRSWANDPMAAAMLIRGSCFSEL
ncbi:MAG: hypothetical protein M1115_08690, partial [Actinobacteria bacterium]|nr:hypothetical protein [Actinomycetota bacterium]